ncbi:MAG: homocysteine S-methyltransferase family protein [Chloroflexi bacterium]|nr:homocysteine S-methyltransferase family protein [Chloroflexota bacterium]
MAGYSDLQARIDRGDVIILDGAIGTQIQAMGAPMAGESWAAAALHTHPTTVQMMHERYIKAGAEIITTNSYAAQRHNLEPMGLGDLTGELNRRAVLLAQNARDRCAKDRPVYIAGSISNFGLLTGSEGIGQRRGGRWAKRTAITEEQSKANLREQAEILAEAGVDLLLAESTGGLTHRMWVAEACASVGLPFWIGFKTHRSAGDPTVRIGYQSEVLFTEALDKVLPYGGRVATIFHTHLDDIAASLPILKSKWDGPIAVYADAGRSDYTQPFADPNQQPNATVEEFVAEVTKFVAEGAQIVGGCCGFGVDYIRPLRDALPKRIAAPRTLDGTLAR